MMSFLFFFQYKNTCKRYCNLILYMNSNKSLSAFSPFFRGEGEEEIKALWKMMSR